MPYGVGDLVLLSAEPAVQKSLYHPRFHGKTGKVIAKRGECYELTIIDSRKTFKRQINCVNIKP